MGFRKMILRPSPHLKVPPSGPALTGKGSAPSWMTKPSMMWVRIWGLTMACGGFESPICLDTRASVGGGADGAGAKATSSPPGGLAFTAVTGSAFSGKHTQTKKQMGDDGPELSVSHTSVAFHNNTRLPLGLHPGVPGVRSTHLSKFRPPVPYSTEPGLSSKLTLNSSLISALHQPVTHLRDCSSPPWPLGSLLLETTWQEALNPVRRHHLSPPQILPFA